MNAGKIIAGLVLVGGAVAAGYIYTSRRKASAQVQEAAAQGGGTQTLLPTGGGRGTTATPTINASAGNNPWAYLDGKGIRIVEAIHLVKDGKKQWIANMNAFKRVADQYGWGSTNTADLLKRGVLLQVSESFGAQIPSGPNISGLSGFNLR